MFSDDWLIKRKMKFMLMFTTAWLLLVNIASAGKPGYCPAIGLGTAGACVEGCSNDWDCHDSEKCCSNGCGHTCQRARTSKPGECPPIDEDNILCVDQINPCKTDMDCGGVEKCCWTGCSPICTDPAPRQGMCPAVPSDTVGACVNECDDDNGCDFPKKCCSNGCGNTCQYPEEPKAGICPAVEEGMFGLCVESCSRDSDCEREEKCCSNGCGHACRPPANNTCVVDGKEYLPGPVPDPDGCNSCGCNAGGGTFCTLKACVCEINGKTYYMGESYPADDECNTCKCRGDGDYLRHPCTDYYCGEGERHGYMKKVAIFAACVGGIGLIITIIVLTAIYCVYKKNNKKKQSKVSTVDQTKAQLVDDAGPLPPKT